MSAPALPSTTSSPRPPTKSLGASSAVQRVVAVLAVDPRRLGRREGAVDLVDADRVVAVAGRDVDGLEGAAVEREVGGAVVADVDLELVRIGGAQAERDPIRGRATRDVQGAGINGGLDRRAGGGRASR